MNLHGLISASSSKLSCAILLELLSQAVSFCVGTLHMDFLCLDTFSPLPNHHLIVPEMGTLDQVSFAMLSHMYVICDFLPLCSLLICKFSFVAHLNKYTYPSFGSSWKHRSYVCSLYCFSTLHSLAYSNRCLTNMYYLISEVRWFDSKILFYFLDVCWCC